ncbi:hypothetical protein DFJ63DRAFT_327146 [Scheffersomyces coipomensis]|uniref:uncharacterized protein n=1 Tax=Scheffersomyces coipomensis TaxID=1788519 RepID=UPI00315CA1F9
MGLFDFPIEFIILILDSLDTRELLIIATFAPYSTKLQSVLNKIDARSIVLKVETIPRNPIYNPSLETFDELTLFHNSINITNILYENSSAIYFDTLKWFNHTNIHTITLQFELNIEDDLSCIKNAADIPLHWLKNSPDLNSIHIGERFKIEQEMDELQFNNLTNITFESCDRQSSKIWAKFLLRHKHQIKQLKLKHHLYHYDLIAMENLTRLELVAFKYNTFPVLAILMKRKLDVIVKGRPSRYFVSLCSREDENKSFPNVTLAEFVPNPHIIHFLESRYNIKFIKINRWEDFPYKLPK